MILPAAAALILLSGHPPSVKTSLSPALSVAPTRSLADAPVHVRATGIQPGTLGIITAITRDSAGATWTSSVTCVADARGQIDLDRCDPSAGSSYKTRDGMGLFWSMMPKGATSDFFVEPMSAEVKYDFTLTISGHAVATQQIERVFAAPDVRVIHLDSGVVNGVVGTAFIPTGTGKRPTVILVGGSGGFHPMDPIAALLASRGYVTLSLAYFGSRGTPASLVNVPVETVSRAIAWLAAQPSVDTARIGIIGHSRGSELALLAGAYLPQIRAVVALAPSTVVWNGINPHDYLRPYAAWTYQGKELPSVKSDGGAAYGRVAATGGKTHRLVLRPIFVDEMRAMSTLDTVEIPIEQTRGPILFVAGDDDGLWPAPLFVKVGLKRLRDARHSYTDEYIHYPNAGHWMFESYVPVAARVISRAGQMPADFGGTIEGDARAAESSWPRIVDFLARALHGPAYQQVGP